MTENNNIIKEKSYKFAVRIVKLYRYLTKEKKEYVLSKQILRSGTSIGALVYEAKFAQSKKDFINKLSIALKEANESSYWLLLLSDTGYLTKKNARKYSTRNR
jgi:four helix bundle protein